VFVGGRVTWRWRKAASHTESSLETLQDKILPATWWCLHPMQIQLIPLLWTIFVPAGLWGRVQVWHRKCWHCHRDCGTLFVSDFLEMKKFWFNFVYSAKCQGNPCQLLKGFACSIFQLNGTARGWIRIYSKYNMFPLITHTSGSKTFALRPTHLN